jgi:hypothetical protein
VDEPEILKSNGEYLFYYANTNYGNDSYISILKAPKKADLSDAEVLKKITIPATLSNIQLFLQNNYLIILGTRYSQTESVLGNARSIAIVYDITDMEHLLLKKLIEVQGSYQDARIVDGELYLISNISLNRYDIAYAEKPFVFNDILPTSIELVLKANPTSALTGNILNSYNKIKTSLPCNSIFYLFPSEETLKEHYLLPNFTLISKLSLENVEKKLEQKLVFGAVDEFHMSEEALYLPSPIYFSSPRKCL